MGLLASPISGWPRGFRSGPTAALVSVLAFALPGAGRAQESAKEPHLIVTSSTQRDAYLATARVWRAKDLPSPAEIVEGPPFARGTRAQLNPPGGIPCTYKPGGAQMGGNTPKFTCRTAEGRSIRVKYFSGDTHTNGSPHHASGAWPVSIR